MPGLTISAAMSPNAPGRVRSTTSSPSASALPRASAPSSQHSGTAPPASKARAALSPVRPSPSTATRLSLKPLTGIIAVPFFAPPHAPNACQAPSRHYRTQRYRTFNVARPIIARIRAMIQNRMTICGSDQPFFS